jgi:hypothetical protein
MLLPQFHLLQPPSAHYLVATLFDLFYVKIHANTLTCIGAQRVLTESIPSYDVVPENPVSNSSRASRVPMVANNGVPSTNFNKEENLSYDSVQDNGVPSSHQLPDIAQLLQDTDSNVWSIRAESFSEIRAIFISDPSGEVMSYTAKIMRTVAEHLTDSHAKVVRAVMDILKDMAEIQPQHVVPYLDKVLTQLFIRLATSKDEQKNQSSLILSQLLSSLRGPILLPVILKIMDYLTPKPRQAALEFTVYLISESQEHLAGTNQQSLMRPLIGKILSAIGIPPSSSDKTPLPAEVKRAGVHCLLKIHDSYKVDIFTTFSF